MTRRKLFAFTVGLLSLGFVGPLASAQESADKPILLGMAKSFFNDLPDVFIKISTDPFAPVVKKTMALDARLSPGDNAAEMAQKLDNGQLQIGVFHGFEYAWAKQQYPDLQTILVVVNKHRDVRTFILVHQDNPAKNLAELRGKTLALALGTKEHCRMYLDRKCADNNQPNAAAFFGKIERSKSCEDALDQICRKNVDAAVIDTIWLEHYKDIKLPYFNRHMRILDQSEAFPSAVIACKKGALSAATLARFRDGLANIHNDRDGLDMMKMLNIHAFEAPPADFGQTIADFLKAYPAPATKVGQR